MKSYEAPKIEIVKVIAADTIATTFTEQGDNEVSWLNSWASAVGGNA